jgi:uncharacterized membrane protein
LPVEGKSQAAAAQTPSRPPADAVQAAAATRVRAIDWLRGLAVILMIQAHAFDAWLVPELKSGAAYAVIKHASGLPSRLFLFLAGVSAALRFEKQLARGDSGRVMRRQLARRGAQILGLAYLFRLQEHVLAGFKGGWTMLLKVDILNAIGASLLLVALVATPRHGRPRIGPALLVAACLVALGAVVGPAHSPSSPWLAALTSYIGGQRPMSWFPLFPWGAWALVGLAVGHLWVRQSGTERGAARVFLLSALAGVLNTGTVLVVRAIDPEVIRYPSELVQQMGPGSFFFRLGVIGALSGVAWAATRFFRGGFSPLVQLGQTSLFIYWIHVDLCYGGIARPLRGHLTIAAASGWIAALVVLMWLASLAWTRLLAHWRAVRGQGGRRQGTPDHTGPVASAPGVRA